MSQNLLKIYDERTGFWQWDRGQKFIVLDDSITEVHLSHKGIKSSKELEIEKENNMRVCTIPDVFLQIPKNLVAYVVYNDIKTEHTITSIEFSVKPRPQPDGYISVHDDEYYDIDARFDAIEKRITDGGVTKEEVYECIDEVLEEAKESGEFDGPRGERGIGIAKSEINSDGELILTYSDGVVNNLGVVIGSDGEAGNDGIAPQIRINDTTNYWEISTDNGATWTSTNTPATGERGEKGDPGEIDLSVIIDDTDINSFSTWSSEKISGEIANIGSGSGGCNNMVVHDTGGGIASHNLSEIMGCVSAGGNVIFTYFGYAYTLSYIDDSMHAIFNYITPDGKELYSVIVDYMGNITSQVETISNNPDISIEGAILYTEQELTEEQKTQARANIGAIDATYVDEEIAAFDIIKVVDELPETGLPNRFYLVPKTEPDTQDLFDEYIWVNDAWEYTATKQLAVDLTDYVKNTDYATTSKYGVVKIGGSGGIFLTNGTIYTHLATNSEIDARASSYKVIVPKNLDYAVKEAICNSKLSLTEEEKAAAQTWLGLGSIESALDSIIAIQNNLIGGDGA